MSTDTQNNAPVSSERAEADERKDFAKWYYREYGKSISTFCKFGHSDWNKTEQKLFKVWAARAALFAPAATQPDVTQQTLDDVMAGIPARDAEIEALQKENLALLHRAAIDAEVASRLARRLFEISAVISPDTPIAQHDISDLLARVKRVVSTLAQQVDKSPETQEKTVDKSPDLQGHASVIFAKAVAWADARVDAALIQPEQEGYGSACDDAAQTHYELVMALRNLQAVQQPVSGADRLPIELCGISEAIGDGGGFWRSCSGCHELNEGMATGPFSETFKCHLGVGCSECGGIGAIWDTTDYDAMADFMAAEYQKRTENTEPVGQDQLRDAAQMIEPSGNSGELAQEFAKRLNDALESLSGEYFNSFNVRMAIKDTVHSFTRIGHEELAKLAISRSQQDAEKVDAALADMVHAMFRSANSIPVTRITIDRKQYEAAIDAARKEQA
ncbi:hypothetical protein EGK70_007120 [Alcaligenes aquatilis]|uniref:hypothetical protein n=1 Tax=Alcaligenes aquatilis TaxID=323284 RepID=UPI000F685DB7|nr:hypothetical protein [Alcaligenes aquatilis]QXR37253.1 hypothetical protein EGK70_007120 [Alcaligenes aquatilis]